MKKTFLAVAVTAAVLAGPAYPQAENDRVRRQHQVTPDMLKPAGCGITYKTGTPLPSVTPSKR